MIRETGRSAEGSLFVRTVDETNPTRIVIDLGPSADAISTDIVDDTLIVIDESTDEQYEHPLPAGTRRTFMRNGVLTIEVEE